MLSALCPPLLYSTRVLERAGLQIKDGERAGGDLGVRQTNGKKRRPEGGSGE